MQYPTPSKNLSRAIKSLYAANSAVYEDISPRCIGIIHHSSEAIRRAANTSTTSIEHMRIDHGRTDIFVSKEFLDSAIVIPVFQEVGRKGVGNLWQLGLEKYVLEIASYLRTNKQMNELRKLIHRAREIEHQHIKSQEQICPLILNYGTF